MLEKGLLLIQIAVMGWVIVATLKFEMASKKGGNPADDGTGE